MSRLDVPPSRDRHPPRHAHRGRHRHRRVTRATYMWRRLGLAAAALVLLGGLAGAGYWVSGAWHPAGTGAPKTSARRGLAVPRFSVVATITTTTPGYPSAKARSPSVTVASTWGGAPQVVPVLARRAGRLKVQLAGVAPAQQSAWIASSAATLARSPYEVVVDLADTKVLVFDEGRLAACVPAGVGTTQQPTPAGRYFVAFLASPPNAGYGPFVVVTSAITKGVADWQQSGMALLTINGPLGADAALAHHGGAITTGSVRLSDDALAKLRPVPPGSPLVVVEHLRLSGGPGLPRSCRRS